MLVTDRIENYAAEFYKVAGGWRWELHSMRHNPSKLIQYGNKGSRHEAEDAAMNLLRAIVKGEGPWEMVGGRTLADRTCGR